MSYDPKDPFYRRAKKEDLRARSAFKIDELVRRFRLVKHGQTIVDLGAAPGGFLQVLAREVGPTGRIVGVDIVAIRPLGGCVTTLECDVYEPTLLAQLRSELAGRQADLVASDLAPKTTGIRTTDEARSVALVERALELARALLRPGGSFVAKVFMGGDFEGLVKQLRSEFGEVHVARPEATRSTSREAYLVATGYRPPRRVDAPENRE